MIDGGDDEIVMIAIMVMIMIVTMITSMLVIGGDWIKW